MSMILLAWTYRKHRLPVVFFLGLVLCATYGLSVTAFEQEHSGTLCDDCHDDHNQVYWEYLIVDELEALGELEVGEEATVRLHFYADCNTNRKSTFQSVEVSLGSENGTLEIVDADRTEYNVVRGESNGRTIEWSITPQQSGSDTLLVHLDGYNTHDGGFHILTDAWQPVEITEEPPDVTLVDDDLHLEPAIAIRGQVVNLSVIVCNAGGFGNANVSLYVDEVSAAHRYALIVGVPLMPHGDRHLTLPLDTATLEGNHTLIVVVENVTPADTNPDDQQATIPLVVHPPGNLQLIEIVMDGGARLLNETVEVTVRARNNFTFTVTTILELELRGFNDNATHIEACNITLDAVSETVVKLDFTLTLPRLPAGNTTLSARLDPYHVLPEIIETDNRANVDVIFLLITPPVELRIGPASITPSPDSVVAGLPATVNVTVVNLGNRTAMTNLTIKAHSGNETHLLATIPLVLAAGESSMSSIVWDTTGWNGSVVLNFDVGELEGELSYLDNHLNLTVVVQPPPWLVFIPASLQTVPATPIGLLPAALAIQLAERNGTPATGVVRLMSPTGTGSEVAFVIDGGGITTVNLTITPSIGTTDYQLEIEAHGRTGTLDFVLEATDPRESLMVEIAPPSPQSPRTGTPLTFTFSLDWNHTGTITVNLSPWLVPAGGGDPVKLSARSVTLKPGVNRVIWTGLLPAGRYTVALHGELFLPGGNLTLPAMGNETLVVSGEIDEDEPLSAPALVPLLMAFIAVSALVRRLRRW